MKIYPLISTALTIFWVSTANAQSDYSHDRVYTANQVSNTVSVINPETNQFLGEIKLGKPYPGVLNPLYKGESLVHGLRYLSCKKMLAVVSIGSNSVTLISTETNKVIKTIYVGRSPHEPTFTPDGKQIWISVRGEAYVSVIDIAKMQEIRRIPVADGPGMISFTPDGKLAYVCSSFTPELDIVSTTSYQIVKKIPVVSPFSPNIFTSPKGEWIAMTHKDVGKVTVINTHKQAVEKVLNTGPVTNHVTFCYTENKLKMLVTVGGENKIRIFSPDQEFMQTDTLNIGALPHGIWTSADGNIAYVGLEFADQVQGIDLRNMKLLPPVKIGQSPQALVYADHAVRNPKNTNDLSPLNDSASTSIVSLSSPVLGNPAHARLAVRPVGLADLVEQIFTSLKPNTAYTLALTKSKNPPYFPDYEINSFITDSQGKYSGQSTGLIRQTKSNLPISKFEHVVVVENSNQQTVLID